MALIRKRKSQVIDWARSEAVLFELLVELAHSAVSNLLGLGGSLLLLGLEIDLRLGKSLLLKLFNDIFIFPSDHVGQITDHASLSERFNSEDLEGLWHDHSLLDVVWVWDSLEDLESLEGSLSSSGLVWKHSANDSPEHP
jgi:hypothetical protein